MIEPFITQKPDMLERLDITVQWGNYEIRVLRFHFISFPAGKMIEFHNHAEYEFHFIPKGKGTVILVDQEYALTEGMLYLTGPGVMHYQEAGPGEAMDELCLHVDIRKRDKADVDPWEAAEAEECIEKLGQLPLFPIHDRHHAMNCFLEAYEAGNVKFTGYYTTIKQLVISILLRTVRAYDPGGMAAEAPVRDMPTYRYHYALQYIRANYSGTITLDHIAEKLNISSRQLQRIFNKMQPGKSFSQILEDVRLEGVCRKLAESTQPIEQIAQSEGFANANYLHNVFRKRFGITPATFRNGRHQIK
ncbi:helix-turn-helix domain-containing protein [Paenibacillus sp. sgz500958]|uniref:AraC family transcriptional regulator n=1 Tax=Paenibacillus sp. sgz500958 TaxID=3242475 RepID=UPI0036D33AAB